jgi:hypothetical protein
MTEPQNNNLRVVCRVGPHPHADGNPTSAKTGCPDLFLLSDGRFAVIGIEATQELLASLPPDAGVGPDERIVIVDRHILVNAKPQIPDR